MLSKMIKYIKKKSLTQERRIAKEFGGKPQIASGAMESKY